MYNCKEKQDTNNNSGVPTGTIINFFGDTAPEGYLSCDGTEYAKSDYPLLANHLASLTTTNLYVGSDSDHFKVPDLRGEFLRGTGTNGHTNQGSGAGVGVHQNSTQFPQMASENNGLTMYFPKDSGFEWAYSNWDKHSLKINSLQTEKSWAKLSASGGDANPGCTYSSRPTNTSVLMCIKY